MPWFESLPPFVQFALLASLFVLLVSLLFLFIAWILRKDESTLDLLPDPDPDPRDIDLLAQLLRQTESAHAAFVQRNAVNADTTGLDSEWPEWYAHYMLTHSTLNLGTDTLYSVMAGMTRHNWKMACEPNEDAIGSGPYTDALLHASLPNAADLLTRLLTWISLEGWTLEKPVTIDGAHAASSKPERTIRVVLAAFDCPVFAIYALTHELGHMYGECSTDDRAFAVSVLGDMSALAQADTEAELTAFFFCHTFNPDFPPVWRDYLSTMNGTPEMIRLASPSAKRTAAMIVKAIGSNPHNCVGVMGQNTSAYTHAGVAADLPNADRILAKLVAWIRVQGIRLDIVTITLDRDPHTNAMSSPQTRELQIRRDIMTCPSFAVYVLAHECGHLFGECSTIERTYRANVLFDRHAFNLAEGEAELTADLFIHELSPSYPDLSLIYFTNHGITKDELSIVHPSAQKVALDLFRAIDLRSGDRYLRNHEGK